MNNKAYTAAERLAEKMWIADQRFAASVEAYTDEALGECLMSDHEVLSKVKKAIYEDDMTLFVNAITDLYPSIRTYLHNCEV